MRNKKWSVLLTFLVCALVPTSHGSTPKQVVKEFIFTSAPFASAHASTIMQLPNGNLMAAWFGGTAEGKSDVAIWAATRSGDRWSAPTVLVREPQIAAWNPVLFYSRDGRLWLYYKFGPGPRSWTAGRVWSDDNGKTWSAVAHLPAGIYGPIKDKPLVLADGTIVSGSSVESYGSWAVWIERSTDNGHNWTRIGPITLSREPRSHEAARNSDPENLFGIIQPAIVAISQTHLRLYARATSNIGKICAADSYDSGLTWTLAHTLDVPNPNSGIDAVQLRDGRVVLVYNDTASGRTPLNLAVSTDGEHFKMFYALETEAGEYSYPAIIQGKNGDLYITYTWQRKRIRFVEFPLSGIPRE